MPTSKKNKLISNLPFRLFIALVSGIILGLWLSSFAENTFCNVILNIVITVKYIVSQFINFCVPLIIIGFVAPSISSLGNNASKILAFALLIAYISSVGAALMATFAGYSVLPFMDMKSDIEGLKSLPNIVFELSIPQIMSVMSALFSSVMIGLAASWNKSQYTINLLNEFQKIVLSIVTKFLIPVLPILISTTFCALSYEGVITKQLPIFLMIVLIVIIGHYVWIAFLYLIAGLYSGKNPLKIIKNYIPAYITAIGTMSSAATLSVAIECAKKSRPTLRDDMINFGIPLFSNIHLCGSVITETFFVMAVSKILYGSYPTVGNMILFCLLLGVFAIGAPGVPGGTVMASLGLIIELLKFDSTGTALMLTIFALQDSFGTACNIISDGALTLILTKYAEKNKIMQIEQTKI